MSGLDNFEFIRQIGKGSYGEVTLQRHKRDRKQYVLKRINLKKASKREQHSAEQEAKLLSKLKHPNIVTYKDSFQKDGYLHIAMQFCEGGDLYTKLKEQKGVALEERQVVEWFVQIAMALQYMHERNILHRDLKTQNIFLTKSKIIKVGDLGIARVLESSSDMATTLIGTPYYMSPELFSNKPYNHKSDVWALGCCVYEMATLKHAFNAKDMNSLVYKILKGKWMNRTGLVDINQNLLDFINGHTVIIMNTKPALQMPPMPRSYTSDLLLLIKGMLHQEPDKRPTVNRILRDPYIKKNISLFLEETKKSRPSSANRPGSASRLRPSVTPQLKKPISSSSNNDGSSAANAKPPPSRVSAQAVDEMDDASDNRNNNMQAPTPSPAILRGHARKPSDGAKVELAPIAEDKPTENKNNNQTNLGSSSSSESTDTVKTKTVKEKSSSEKSVSDSPPRKKDVPKKKRNVLKKGKDSDTDSIASVDSVSSSGPSSSRSKKDNIFKHVPSPRSYSPRGDISSRSDISEDSDMSFFHQPKPVDNPRPLPALPKANESEGLPQRRASAGDLSNQNKENGKSSSTSSSKDENASWDMETPREPNLSARERRRAKNPGALSYENPTSARINLKPNRHESQRVTKAEKSEMDSPRSDIYTPRSVRTPRMPAYNYHSNDYVTPHSEYNSGVNHDNHSWDYPVKSKSSSKRIRQPSLADSSSSDEDTLKGCEDIQVDKEKQRENKEMKNFITLLDTTLHLNKEDEKSEEEEKTTEPSIQEMDIHRSVSLPSVETLCNADRLTSRIQILHADCVRGVGFEILHKAFHILANIEDDELEPQLVELMGKEKFDLYAGKIWQLKFCNECFEHLPNISS